MRLANLGANVAICDVDLSNHLEFELDRTQSRSISAVDELLSLGVDAFAAQQDAADFNAQRDRRCDGRALGRIDVVVCNAGGSVGLPGIAMGPTMFASTLDPRELDLIIRRNLTATVATCVAVAPTMKSQRSGSIVTLGSVNGVEALRSGASAHYGAAKAAVIMYSRYLAQELGPFGVRVNCLLPGVTITGRALSVFAASESEQFGRQAVELERKRASTCHAGRRLRRRARILATHLAVLHRPHFPVQLAKELATLDILSEGRLLVGIGVGCLEAEYRAVVVDFTTRVARHNEYAKALRVLWTADPPVFEGTYVTLHGVDA